MFEPAFTLQDAIAQLRGTSVPGKAARDLLTAGQQRLTEAFPRAPIRDLIAGRVALVDRLLQAAWHAFELDCQPDAALLAVGGYGRGELFPHSDVDVLVLLKQPAGPQCCGHMEGFIACLWDMGLEIGHSVRTLDECVELARDDLTIVTSLMESRTLAGPEALRTTLMDRTAPDQLWPSDQFFAAKCEEQHRRHHKHNDTEYNLEPDLKNARGGLRDLQMIGWVMRRHFYHPDRQLDLNELVTMGFLKVREYRALRRCQTFLFTTRWALHQISGRNENRLLFDWQRQVAELLGHRDSNANLAVEHFMKEFYRAVLALSVITEVLLQYFDETILHHDAPQRVTPLNRRFQVRNGRLEITHADVFQEHPSALLEMFLLLAQHPEIRSVRADTLRRCLESRRLIDEAYRTDPRHTALFMQLLRAPHNLWTQLRRMKRYGILGRYLPEFGQVLGLMQYDLFHRYTVDAHTLLVVKYMRRLRHEETREHFPLACEVYWQLPKPDLLYIAGLYHDIAKGRGGDHSELGARDALAFCQRHGLSNWDAKLVSWLVQSHLLMSVTAQRKDIADPAVVHEFARQVGDLVHLDYLYCLTVCDINATNPSLWNSWKDSLLRQLYIETKRALRRGLNNPVHKQDWIDDTRKEALKLLHRHQIPASAAEQLWSGIGDEYFLRENARNIAWHTEAILAHPDRQEPLVLVKEAETLPKAGATQVFVYTPDVQNLFAATVNALDHLNLTILDARIITSADGFSLDTYLVLDENGSPIGNDRDRLEQIRSTLVESLRDPGCYHDVISRRLPRQNQHFTVPTRVVISNDIVNDRTVVDVQTLDRPGLLARVGRIFMEFDLLLQNARIATLGERAEDVFFVTHPDGRPVSDPDLCLRLEQRLKEVLDDTSRDGITNLMCAI